MLDFRIEQILILIAWTLGAVGAQTVLTQEGQLILRLRDVISQTLNEHRKPQVLVVRTQPEDVPQPPASGVVPKTSCSPLDFPENRVANPAETTFMAIARMHSEAFRYQVGLSPLAQLHVMKCPPPSSSPLLLSPRNSRMETAVGDDGDYDELIPPTPVIALVVLVPGLTIVLVYFLMVASFLMADTHFPYNGETKKKRTDGAVSRRNAPSLPVVMPSPGVLENRHATGRVPEATPTHHAPSQTPFRVPTYSYADT